MAMDTDPDTLDWIQKGVIVATIAQKPYTMAMVGLRMLDDLHHNRPPRLDAQWSKDSSLRFPPSLTQALPSSTRATWPLSGKRDQRTRADGIARPPCAKSQPSPSAPQDLSLRSASAGEEPAVGDSQRLARSPAFRFRNKTNRAS